MINTQTPEFITWLKGCNAIRKKAASTITPLDIKTTRSLSKYSTFRTENHEAYSLLSINQTAMFYRALDGLNPLSTPEVTYSTTITV